MGTSNAGRIRALTAAAITLAVGAVSSSAGATGVNSSYIPNGQGNCEFCHTNSIPDLNLFGTEVLTLIDAQTLPEDWWPLLRDLDSDLDGQTNGEELGDPCDPIWVQGDTPDRVIDISNPGDELSLSVDPTACQDIPMGGAGGGGGAAGGLGGMGGTPDIIAGGEGGMGGMPQAMTGGGGGAAAPADDDGSSETFTSEPDAGPLGCSASTGPTRKAPVTLLLGLIGLALTRRRRSGS